MQTKETDPIIAEVWAVRKAYASRFDYNVEAIFRDIRAKQEASECEYVRLASPSAVPAHENRTSP